MRGSSFGRFSLPIQVSSSFCFFIQTSKNLLFYIEKVLFSVFV